MILTDSSIRARIINVDSSDRYVFNRDKPITYTNANSETLTLRKGSVFWYMVVGHSEIISAHQYGQGPIFRLSDAQIEKLSLYSSPEPTPEFTKRRKAQYKKFVAANKESLSLNLKNAVKNAVKNRDDDSTFHVRVEYSPSGDIVATTDVNLGGKTKYGRAVRMEIMVSGTQNVLRFRLLMSPNVESKQLILRTQFVKDTLALIERLKKFMEQKYNVQFEATYFVSATLYGIGHNGPMFDWSSRFHLN